MENQLAQILAKFFPKSTHGFSESTVYSFNERLLATASYIYFVSAGVLLLSASESGFVKLHAKHAFLYLVLTVLAFLLPDNLRALGVAIIFLLNFFSAVSAFNGRLILIPWVSNLLENFDI